MDAGAHDKDQEGHEDEYNHSNKGVCWQQTKSADTRTKIPLHMPMCTHINTHKHIRHAHTHTQRKPLKHTPLLHSHQNLPRSVITNINREASNFKLLMKTPTAVLRLQGWQRFVQSCLQFSNPAHLFVYRQNSSGWMLRNSNGWAGEWVCLCSLRGKLNK